VKSIGNEISVDRIIVNSGDVIIGDSTGLVVVPHKQANTVLERARRYQADDIEAAAQLQRGISFTEVMKEFKRI
jgi:regulator of RNase E activity RraA